MSTSDQEEAARRAALEARIADAVQVSSRDVKDAEPDDPNSLRLAARVGSELVASLVVGFFIGWFLDGRLGTRPVLMLVGLAVGCGAGMLSIYRVMNGFGPAAGYARPKDANSKKDRGQAGDSRERNAMVETSKHGKKRD